MCLEENQNTRKMPIIIAPKYTRATFITSLASDHLYNWMRKNNYTPIKISGFRTRKPIIRKELFMANMQPKPLLICYFGHGLDDSWIGIEDVRARFFKRRLIKLGINEDWLDKDAIIHTISCYTMNELGPELVKGKVRAYFGSTEKMLVNPIDNFIEPKTIPDFIDIFTIGQKFLCSGATTGEAFQYYIQRCNEILRNYEQSGLLEKSKQLRNAYYAIKINRDYYGLVGQTDAQWITDEELIEMKQE